MVCNDIFVKLSNFACKMSPFAHLTCNGEAGLLGQEFAMPTMSVPGVQLDEVSEYHEGHEGCKLHCCLDPLCMVEKLLEETQNITGLCLIMAFINLLTGSFKCLRTSWGYICVITVHMFMMFHIRTTTAIVKSGNYLR